MVKAPESIPNLANAYERDGDICSIDDLGGFASDSDLAPSIDEQREQEVERLQSAISSGDFSERNNLLKGVAGAVGDMKQAYGAAEQFEAGRLVSMRFLSPQHAREIASKQHKDAVQLGLLACSECVLREFCDLQKPEELIQRLYNATTRQRFARRVENRNNNHLCEDNLKPGRLPKI